ncbi:hypothetical protein ACFX2C_003852 [Malus domestica]
MLDEIDMSSSVQKRIEGTGASDPRTNFLERSTGCNQAQVAGFSTDWIFDHHHHEENASHMVTARMHIEIYKYPAWWVFFVRVLISNMESET